MCLCYLFSAKTAWQLVNRKAIFLQNESIRITNRIDSNRELECSSQYCSNLFFYFVNFFHALYITDTRTYLHWSQHIMKPSSCWKSQIHLVTLPSYSSSLSSALAVSWSSPCVTTVVLHDTSSMSTNAPSSSDTAAGWGTAVSSPAGSIA